MRCQRFPVRPSSGERSYGGSLVVLQLAELRLVISLADRRGFLVVVPGGGVHEFQDQLIVALGIAVALRRQRGDLGEQQVVDRLLQLLHRGREHPLVRRDEQLIGFEAALFESRVDEAFVDELDAIITSPPFFDSIRFHLGNWMRLWFSGWEAGDFHTQPKTFVDERQKAGFEVYEPVLRQAKERLKSGGVLVVHLGKSKKCDMAAELVRVGARWFRTIDIFDETVGH